jgi:branched-chain amino acid transport system substrate-binding protein
VKAARDANLQVNFYTYYAGTVGVPQAMGEAGVDHVKVVSYWNANGTPPSMEPMIEAYKKKYGATSDPYSQALRSWWSSGRGDEEGQFTDPPRWRRRWRA